MGKVIKEKKHRGVHRSEGAFSASERKEAATAAVRPVRRDDPVVAKSVSTAQGSSGGMSRGQRKRLAKKVAADRKKVLIGSAEKKTLQLKEGIFSGLADELSLSLPSIEKKMVTQTGSMKMTKKNRKRLMNAEVANFQAVLAHPAFQSNPMSTIQQHLENSIRAAQASKTSSK